MNKSRVLSVGRRRNKKVRMRLSLLFPFLHSQLYRIFTYLHPSTTSFKKDLKVLSVTLIFVNPPSSIHWALLMSNLFIPVHSISAIGSELRSVFLPHSITNSLNAVRVMTLNQTGQSHQWVLLWFPDKKH